MTTARATGYAARLAAFGVLAFLAVALGFACAKSTKPAAGLEVVISTDLRTPQDFDTLEVKVSQDTSPGVPGAPLFDNTSSVPNGVTLPTSVSIAAGSSADQGARIVVRGSKGGTLVIERTAQVQIPTDSLLELDIFLSSSCANVPCGALTTCITGSTCVSIVVTPSQLKPYQPIDMGGGSSGGTSGAPDSTVDKDGGVGCGPGSCAASDCFVQMPVGCGCIPAGNACPYGGTCSGGSCGGFAVDSGTGGCSSAAVASCQSMGGCISSTGGAACSCTPSGGPCPTGGTCNGGICGGPPPADASTGQCAPGMGATCTAGGGCFLPSPGGGASCVCVGSGAPCPGGGTCYGGGCSTTPGCTPGSTCSIAGGQFGTCDATGTCIVQACGQSGQPCCGSPPGNCNAAGVGCNTSSNTCVTCGALNEPCCNGGCSGSGLMCNGSTCVVQCGQPGAPCCPYNQCNTGCCENGTCTAQGSTCSVYGGTCANGGCQGDTCGGGGQPCCNGVGCTNGFSVCRAGTCQQCGMPGSGAYANCCPGDICMVGGLVCSHAADAGSGGSPTAGYCVNCGGYRQACCDPDAGKIGAGMMTPCQTGYTCTSGVCQ